MEQRPQAKLEDTSEDTIKLQATMGESLGSQSSTGQLATFPLAGGSPPSSTKIFKSSVTLAGAFTKNLSIIFKARVLTPKPENLIPNPSFEYGSASTGNWTAYPTGFNETFERSTEWSSSGTHSLHVKAKSTTSAAQVLGVTLETPLEAIPITSKTAYSASAVVNVITLAGSNQIVLILEWFRSNGTYIEGTLGTGSEYFATTTGVHTLKVVNAVAPAQSVFVRPTIYSVAEALDQKLDTYLDAVILVEGETVPAYFDGDLPGHSWRGTPGNSISLTTIMNLVKVFTLPRVLTAVVKPSPTLLRVMIKALTAAVKPNGVLTKAFVSLIKSFTAKVTSTPVLAKSLTLVKSMPASIKPESLLSRAFVVTVQLVAKLKASSVFSKLLNVTFLFPASITPTVSVFRKTLTLAKTFIASVQPSAILSKAFANALKLKASIPAAVSNFFDVVPGHVRLAASVAPVVNLKKAFAISHKLIAQVQATSLLRSVTTKIMTAVISITASPLTIVEQVVILIASLTPTGKLKEVLYYVRQLPSTLSFFVEVPSHTTRRLLTKLNLFPSIKRRQTTHALQAEVGFLGRFVIKIRQLLRPSISFAANVGHITRHQFAAFIAPATKATRVITQAFLAILEFFGAFKAPEQGKADRVFLPFAEGSRLVTSQTDPFLILEHPSPVSTLEFQSRPARLKRGLD